MTTKILSIKYYGPYWSPTRTEAVVDSLTDFIFNVRALIEDNVEAIAILKDEQIIAVWLNEPDVDSDGDSFYEVAPEYQGQQYVLYRRDEPGFWNTILFNFGIKYIPEGAGCTAKRYIHA